MESSPPPAYDEISMETQLPLTWNIDEILFKDSMFQYHLNHYGVINVGHHFNVNQWKLI